MTHTWINDRKKLPAYTRKIEENHGIARTREKRGESLFGTKNWFRVSIGVSVCIASFIQVCIICPRAHSGGVSRVTWFHISNHYLYFGTKLRAYRSAERDFLRTDRTPPAFLHFASLFCLLCVITVLMCTFPNEQERQCSTAVCRNYKDLFLFQPTLHAKYTCSGK